MSGTAENAIATVFTKQFLRANGAARPLVRPRARRFLLEKWQASLENSDKKAALFYSHRCFPRKTAACTFVGRHGTPRAISAGDHSKFFSPGRARQNEHLIPNANRGSGRASERALIHGGAARGCFALALALDTQPRYFGQLLVGSVQTARNYSAF